MWPIDSTFSGPTTPGQSGPCGDDNEGVLCIPQSSCINGTSLSDCLVSYAGHSLGGLIPLQRCSLYSTVQANWATRTLVGRGSYPFAEGQSVYSIVQANWATRTLIGGGGGGVLSLRRGAVSVFYSPSQLGKLAT